MSQEELWESELEALEATYGVLETGKNDDDIDDGGVGDERLDDAAETGILTVVSRSPPRIRALLIPRGQTSSSSRFVRATLVVDCSEEYCRDGARPSPPPVSVSLADVKGLGDERRSMLLSRVEEELRDAVDPTFVLGSLVEAALDATTELNAPEGECSICLEPLVSSPRRSKDEDDDEGKEDDGGNRDRLVKLRCFHCLHLRCASRWWASSSDERRPSGDRGARRGLRCPQCREVAAVSERASARLDALAASCSSAAVDGEENNDSSTWGLSDRELENLRESQAQRKKGLEEQEKRGALVSERWAVSLSELALSAAAAATTETNAPPPPPPEESKRNENDGGDRGGGRHRGRGGGRGRGRGRGRGGERQKTTTAS